MPRTLSPKDADAADGNPGGDGPATSVSPSARTAEETVETHPDSPGRQDQGASATAGRLSSPFLDMELKTRSFSAEELELKMRKAGLHQKNA